MAESDNKPYTRMSVRELEKDPAKCNAFLRAWKLIQDLPPSNPNSFWAIAGYHGEPLKPRMVSSEGEPADDFWGGYCQHSNVLFPTWHRFYVLRLEQALRAVCPTDDIAMAYWDETSEENLNDGIPDLLTRTKVTIDGREEDNPLLNFTLPVAIEGSQADEYYHKPKGYTTVRYPYSGIMSPAESKKAAEEHNKRIDDTDAPGMLTDNVIFWLNLGPATDPPTKEDPNSVSSLYKHCIQTDDYNKFSNTDSAATSDDTLEQPHNDIHLSVGGYDLEGSQSGLVSGANGDMGVNEVAGFDPIFFFHHSNVDRLFWVWQKAQGHTNGFTIRHDDEAGTNPSSKGGQGPSPGQKPNQQLTLDTVLYPFQHANDIPVNSKDCFNIEDQLGYTYTIGSLDKEMWPEPPPKKTHVEFHEIKEIIEIAKILRDAIQTKLPLKLFFDVTNVTSWENSPILFFTELYPKHQKFHFEGKEFIANYMLYLGNINRDDYPGSFLIRAYHKENGKKTFIGGRSVLDRWNAKHCKNCQLHRLTKVTFDLKNIILSFPPKLSRFELEIVYNDPKDGTTKIVNVDPLSNVEEKPLAKLYGVLQSVKPDE